MIFPVWQSLGQSSHLLAQECGELLAQKTTHTGTLDPMAEGVVVILSDDDRYAKGALGDWDKVYNFEVLWGVQTDSGDRLGVVEKVEAKAPDTHRLTEILKNFPPTYQQTIPAFSARRFAGKSSFDWAKSHQQLVEKKRQVYLKDFTFRTSKIISTHELIKQHHAALSHVQGNFRQTKIQESWTKNILVNQQFLITHHTVSSSPGTYIRQLVQDLAQHMQLSATTWSITRIQNGPYTKEDCVEVSELRDLHPNFKEII